jgi:hypothetical protein
MRSVEAAGCKAAAPEMACRGRLHSSRLEHWDPIRVSPGIQSNLLRHWDLAHFSTGIQSAALGTTATTPPQAPRIGADTTQGSRHHALEQTPRIRADTTQRSRHHALEQTPRIGADTTLGSRHHALEQTPRQGSVRGTITPPHRRCAQGHHTPQGHHTQAFDDAGHWQA